MPKMSRDKGKVGEREIVLLAKEAGFDKAARAWLTPQLDGDIAGVPGVHLEVRRREGTSIEAWCKEVEAKTRNGNVPVVAWRRSNQPWRASLPLTDLLKLLKPRELKHFAFPCPHCEQTVEGWYGDGRLDPTEEGTNNES